MSINIEPHPHPYLPLAITSLGSLPKLYTERLGQPNGGCPCYAMLQYVRCLLLPYSPYPPHTQASLSDIVTGLIMLGSDYSDLNTLNTTLANSEALSFAPDAGSPTLSLDLPNFIHNPLPNTQPNPENVTDSSCTSGYVPMNDGTLDPAHSLDFDGSSLFSFDTPASTDVISSHMSREPAVLQCPAFDESLFAGNLRWNQPLEDTEPYHCFGDHTIYPQVQDSSSAYPSGYDALASPVSTSTCSESSSPWSEYSMFTDEPGSFTCRWNAQCSSRLEADKSEVAKHLQLAHSVKPGGDKLYMTCSWVGCQKTMKKESISRHIVAVHLSKKTECSGCGKQFARWDSKLRHIKNSKRECTDSEPESPDSKRPRLL